MKKIVMIVDSIPCPVCLPSERIKELYKNYPHYSPRSFWEVWENTAKCTNCGYERLYKRRSTTKKSKPNATQLKKVESLKKRIGYLFLYSDKKELHKVETMYQRETGFLWVSINTHEHILLDTFIHLYIGNRGGITVMSVSGVSNIYTKKRLKKAL